MNKITTYNDLLLEKQRLALLLQERYIQVRAELEEIKGKLKPLVNILEMVEKVTSKDMSNPLANASINIGVNLLLRNLLLRNAGWITKLLMPVLVKNYLSHEVLEKGNIFSKIGQFLQKKFIPHRQV